MLVVGNKNYGLASSIANVYPNAEFYSRTSGYNLGKREIRETVADHTLSHESTLLVSALGDFSQVMLAETIIKKWKTLRTFTCKLWTCARSVSLNIHKLEPTRYTYRLNFIEKLKCLHTVLT